MSINTQWMSFGREMNHPEDVLPFGTGYLAVEKIVVGLFDDPRARVKSYFNSVMVLR